MTLPLGLLAVVTSAAVCLAASPYLARLTRTVPDRDDRRWYRGAPVGPAVHARTAVVAAGLGALAGAAAGWTALLPAFVALALFGTPLTLIDVTHHRLPNRLVYPAAVTALGLLAFAATRDRDGAAYVRAVEGGAASFAVLFGLLLISPRSFGRGDVRLGGVLGLYLGYAGWPAVYYGIFAGFVLGSVVAVVLLVSGRATRKSALAFGPMLLLGALLVLAFDLTA